MHVEGHHDRAAVGVARIRRVPCPPVENGSDFDAYLHWMKARTITTLRLGCEGHQPGSRGASMGVTDSAPDVTLTESLRQSRMPVAGSGRIIRAEFISTHPWCHRMQT